MAEEKNAVTGLVALGVVALALSLFLVWLNIERAELGYELKELQTERTRQESLAAKLTVERDNLTAPHRLRGTASEYGLRDAAPEQIRLMGGQGVD